MMRVRWLAFVCLSIAFCCWPAHAQGTYTAASCNYSDVNAVINGPTHTVVNGDTINIPAGTCTWSSNLVAPSGVGFTLIGAGTPNSGSATLGAATPSTLIMDNAGSSEPLMRFSPSYGAPTMRVSMMAIDPYSTSTQLVDPIWMVGSCASGGCPNVRVDNITAGLNTDWSQNNNGANAEAIILAGDVFGSLDHNTINANGTIGEELFNAQLGAYLGVGQYGDNSWAQPDSFGTANNLFAENNVINTTGYLPMVDSEQDDAFTNRGGSRIVLRYNTVNTSGPSYGLFQDHGLDSGGRARGAREAEIYNNTMNCSVGGGRNCFIDGGLRSGTGLFFNNHVVFTNGAYGNTWVGLAVYRNVASWGAPFYYCGGAGPFDQNDGTVYYSGTMSAISGLFTMTASSPNLTNLVPSGEPYSVYDMTQGFYAEVTSNTVTTITVQASLGNAGNTKPWTGFDNGDSYQVLRATLCADQPGRGQGNYISGTTPSPTGWVGEALDPIYRWGDTATGGSVSLGMVANSNKRLIANRDFYDQAAGIQTSPTSPFNGTSGTGWGTLSNRPDSCTNQVGYFATDVGAQGTLYQCQSGSWAAYYTPYTYPHPLDGGTAVTGGDPPAPPTSLTATVE